MSPLPRPAPDGVCFRLEFRIAGQPEPWLFNLKSQALSLAIGTATSYTFDREGRLFAAFASSRNFRRGLDGRILEKYSSGAAGQEQRHRRFLAPEEAAAFLGHLQERLQQIAQAQRAGRLLVDREGPAGAAAHLEGWLQRLRRWDLQAYARDAERFHAIYQPVSILPPDQYLALVVQSTLGCPWNRCSFCDLYPDRPYRIRSAAELQAHLEEIAALLGAGLRLRRSVFLGDGNMLAAPFSHLRQSLALVRRTFAGEPLAERFYGFTDALGVARHSVEELRLLGQQGLHRLYLGLETGNDELLHLLGKPGSAGQAVAAVHQLRQAGLQVGVIVLLGPGGQRWAAAHERDTIRVLGAMALGRQDLLYFSPLVAAPGSAYARQAAADDLGSMDLADMAAQRRRLEAGVRTAADRPRTALYDIRDFAY